MPHATKPSKTSDILRVILARCEGEGSISIGEFLNLLGDRAFCLAILVFALPNSLPIPGIPGFSTITGLPIVFIAAQMMLGRDVIWLPKRVAARSFSKSTLAKILTKSIPFIEKLEKFLKPRWTWLTEGFGERVVGLMLVVLALILSLPIPGGNFLPGISITLLSLCLLEKDGKLLLAAIFVSLTSFYVMLKVVIEVFSWLFGVIAGWWNMLF